MNKPHSQSSASSTGGSSPSYHRDTRIEEGKLFYEKRWFRRGQSVQVEPKSGEKFPALISAIGTEAIWVRRTSDQHINDLENYKPDFEKMFVDPINTPFE